MVQKVDEQIKKLKELHDKLSTLHGKRRWEMKENVLTNLKKIDTKTIEENVKMAKRFLHFIKLDQEMPKKEVDKKHTALQKFIEAVKKNKESEKMMQTLEQIDAKIKTIYVNQSNGKQRFNNFVNAFSEQSK
jgi:hypothetical protein